MSDLETRLKNLPPKVGTPLQRLLTAGQINAKIVETVLDAGDLAGGDYPKLLGFTAGMLYLQSQGIPVHDVIAMAKQQGRRINLGWTPNRWKAEHERLSRAEATVRLAEENVAYDVSQFAGLLPNRFAGYLIQNSRRLGMEGLRQRHCVASYHQDLIDRRCAIASVFLDKQRWTVQLMLTGNKEAPLRIVQCRTRYNGSASVQVLNHIHDLLNIKQIKDATPYTRVRNEISRSYMQNLRAVLPVLREHAVERVAVQFDGSGDSGSIDSIHYEPEIDSRIIEVQVYRVAREFIQNEWRYTRNIERVNLHDAIQEITDDYLEETGVDWYNNEGGFGDLIIDVIEGTVAIEVNVRTAESETAYSATKDIETGEEV